MLELNVLVQRPLRPVRLLAVLHLAYIVSSYFVRSAPNSFGSQWITVLTLRVLGWLFPDAVGRLV